METSFMIQGIFLRYKHVVNYRSDYIKTINEHKYQRKLATILVLSLVLSCELDPNPCV